MPAPKGHKKWGGRQKGTPNKSTQELFEKCEARGLDIFDSMIDLAITENDPVKKFDRLRELAQYLYPKRKAIQHSGEIGLPEPAITEESLEDRINKIKGK